MSETNVQKGNPHVRVLILDDTSSNIPTVLGITEERTKELENALIKAWTEKESVTSIMEEISKHVMHANELTYCIFHLGCHTGNLASKKETLENLLDLRKRLGESGEED